MSNVNIHSPAPPRAGDDYYPFGLTYNSYKRSTALENKFKFQGQEHIDDLGLNWVSFKWRNHQPDIGRFFNVDPLAEDYYYNSPYAFSENHVTTHIELEGLEKVRFQAAMFTPFEKGRTIVTQQRGIYQDNNIYNKNFANSPEGGSTYNKARTTVETSDGSMGDTQMTETRDSMVEEFFDLFLFGDIDDFGYELQGIEYRRWLKVDW